MDREHWQEVQQLFEGALERPSEEVSAWLDEACGGDESLKAEVEELLRSDFEAASFIRTEVGSGSGPPKAVAQVPQTSRFGKYEIEKKIGQGGFGVVYRGRDPMLQRYVAVKTCSTEDGQLRQRFFREGRISAGLQHPNVTTVHDLGVEDGMPYLVQEFLRGEDLDHVIERREPMSLLTKLDYLVQIARGLEYAHGAGVLHRDIKPANVRIQDSGSVKIMDFGIAKVLKDDTGLTGTGMALGTVGYLAPEQLRGEEVDARADIFSFGVLAYELLTFERPFKGDNFSQVSYQLLYKEPVPIATLWPQCPTSLSTVIERCLAKECADRHTDFTAVLAELEPQLETLRSGSSLELMGPTVGMPSEELTDGLPAATDTVVQPAARGPMTWLVVAGLAAILGGAAWWVWRSAKEPVPVEALAAAAAPAGNPPTEDPSSSDRPTAGPSTDEPTSSDPVSGDPPSSDPPSSTSSGAEPPIEVDSDPVAGSSAAAEAERQPTVGSSRPVEAAAQPQRSIERPPSPSPSSPPTTTPPSTSVATREGPESASESRQEPGNATSRAESESAVDPASRRSGLPDLSELGPAAGTRVAAKQPRPEPPPSAADPVPPASAKPVSSQEPPPPPAPGMQRGDLITGGSGVVAPRLLDRPHPEYPERARRRRKEDRVVVRVLVDENGRVVQAIAPAEDRFGFGEAARQSALLARFEPATRQGIAGKMWIEMPFEFKLR